MELSHWLSTVARCWTLPDTLRSMLRSGCNPARTERKTRVSPRYRIGYQRVNDIEVRSEGKSADMPIEKVISQFASTNQDERSAFEKKMTCTEQDGPMEARPGQLMKYWQSHRCKYASKVTYEYVVLPQK